MVPIDPLLDCITHHPLQAGRPRVTLSYAQSLDGSIAVARGSQLNLSGPESLEMTHRLRAIHDGILVGIGTVLADNPQLTVRLVNGKDPQPIVIDSWLRTPEDSNLFQNGSERPWIFTTYQADRDRQTGLERSGARVYRLPARAGRVDLPAMMVELYRLGVKTLMVEGGARTITSFLAEKIVDLLVVTIAPVLVGGQRSLERPLHPDIPASFNGFDPDLGHFPGLGKADYLKLGPDLVVWGELNWGQE